MSHPLRITIIRLLYAAPRSFSDLVKYLSLESTSKLSFHLDTLGPLIVKNGDGNYILSSDGHTAHSLLVSIENDAVIGSILPSLGIEEAKPARIDRLLHFFKESRYVFYHYTGVLLVLGGLYLLFRILEIDKSLSFFGSFVDPFFTALFFFPLGIFIHFVYFCKTRDHSFSYLVSGLLSFPVLYSAFLSFLDQTYYFIKSLLAIPEVSYQFNFRTGWWETQEEGTYFPGSFLKMVWGYFKTILFNEYLYPQIIHFSQMERVWFWLVISLFLIIFLYVFSPLVGWKWASSYSIKPIFLPRKFQFFVNWKIWFGLIVSYFFILILSSRWIYDTTQRQIEFLVPSDGSFIPSYIHYVPILPVLVITIIFLLINVTPPNNHRRVSFLFAILLVSEPLVFLFLILLDFLLFMNILFEIPTLVLFSLKLLTILIQTLVLAGYAILLTQLIEPKREFSSS
jgi:hypothetical protein